MDIQYCRPCIRGSNDYWHCLMKAGGFQYLSLKPRMSFYDSRPFFTVIVSQLLSDGNIFWSNEKKPLVAINSNNLRIKQLISNIHAKKPKRNYFDNLSYPDQLIIRLVPVCHYFNWSLPCALSLPHRGSGWSAFQEIHHLVLHRYFYNTKEQILKGTGYLVRSVNVKGALQYSIVQYTFEAHGWKVETS